MKSIVDEGPRSFWKQTGWVAWLCAVLLGLTAGKAAAQPANDLFDNFTIIDGQSGTISGTNVDATLDPCEPISVVTDDNGTQTISNSVWFAWTAPVTGVVEFDTIGSSFDTILSVYTTPTDLCDPAATNIISDDNNGFTQFGDANLTSYLTFNAIAGTTYYISVNGSGTNVANNTGNYNLDWAVETVQTVPSGTFAFTSGSYIASVNETSDSSASPAAELDSSVSPSIPGARLTITRTDGLHGLVQAVSLVQAATYTDIFQTNYFGTNIISEVLNTNTGLIDTYNLVQNFWVYTNKYGYYDGGAMQTYTVVGVRTNLVGLLFQGVTPTVTVTTSGTNGPVIPGLVTNSLPTFAYAYTNSATNFIYGVTNIISDAYFATLVTNVLVGTNAGNGKRIVSGGIRYTNFANVYSNVLVTTTYGEALSLSIIYPLVNPAPVAPLIYTNLFLSNSVVVGYYATNAYYTNGALALDVYTNVMAVTGQTNELLVVGNNVTTISGSSSGTGDGSLPVFNPGPVGIRLLQGVPPTPITNGIITNYFCNAAVFTTNTVSSAPGLATYYATNMLIDNQAASDLVVPVADYSVGGIPDGSRRPAMISVTMTQVQLDPMESAVLQPPQLGQQSSCLISLLNNTFVNGQATNLAAGNSILNFERATFRVNEDTPGYATIKVNRAGGNANAGITVEYFVDSGPPVTSYVPVDTFPLQAGSDYANIGTDFTQVSGTLAWGAYDYNPKSFSIPIKLNGNVKFNQDIVLDLYKPSTGAQLGDVSEATLTIRPYNQPAGAMDRNWNTDNSFASDPPQQLYPGTSGNGGTVYAVANQPTDGKTIVAGVFTSFDSQLYSRLVRCLTNGYQDTTFMVYPNSGPNDFVTSLALYPTTSPYSGKILIGGNFTSFNGQNRYHIARLNADGSLDTTFNPGLGFNGLVKALALMPNDQVIAVGAFSTFNSTNINNVARINADGSLDTTFNPGTGVDGEVNAVAVDASGRVLIGGSFSSVAGIRSGGVGRLNTDGSVDTTFGVGVGTYNPESAVTDPVHAVVVQPNGEILVGGGFAYYQMTSFNGIVRLNPDGTVDPAFKPGVGTYNWITGQAETIDAITLQPDGKILIGGNFTSYNETHRVGIARLFAEDGTLDTSFMDTAYDEYAGIPNIYFNQTVVNTNYYPAGNQQNSVLSISVEPGTTNVLIGGSFLWLGGGYYERDDKHNRSNVARLVGGSTTGPGNIELVYNGYTVNKSAGNLFVSVTRTNGNLGVAQADLITPTNAPGPGILNVTNFSDVVSTPVWDTDWTQSWMVSYAIYGPNYNTLPAGNSVANETYVNLTITNNTTISGNLAAEIVVTNPATSFANLGGEFIPLGVALGAQVKAPFTVIDDAVQPGVLGFSPTNLYVVEGNNAQATITVTRTNGAGNVVTVHYATSNGVGPHGATNGVDYTAVSGTLTFGVGQLTQTFTVPIKNVTTYTPDRSLYLKLFTTSGGAGLGQTNATLTIINANYQPGQITFAAPTFSTNENNRFAQVTVNRLGGSAGLVQVNMFTTNGTARVPTNYLGTNVLLSWNSGDATPRVISIPVFDDGLVTSNLTVGLGLTNATAYGYPNTNLLSLSPYTNALLWINNVDAYGTVQFSSPIYTVKKYAGYALVPVVRTGGSAQTVTVSYFTTDGTAVAGSDYTTVTNTITFTNGQVAAYFKVPILNNLANSGLTYLNLNLTGAAGTLGAVTNAVLNIIDSGIVNETPGGADSTFSTLVGFNNSVYSLLLTGTNQLLVGGDFTMADGVTRYHIARLNSDGTMDGTFLYPATTWGANGTVRSLALEADNRILVGGTFTRVDNVVLNNIARLNTDGTLDSLFNPGSGANNSVYAVAGTTVNGLTKVLAAGAFTTLNGVTLNGIGELNYDGSVNTNFNPGGLGANATVYALALYPTNSPNYGKILIGGDFTAYDGATNFNHLARLNADGSVDNTFNPTGSGPNGSVRAITLQLNDQILIGGLFTNVNGSVSNYNHIARLNADGSVDPSFNPGLGGNNSVLSIAVQSDGRIVAGGTFTTFSGVTRNYVTRLNPDGTVDPTINFGIGANNFVAAVAVEQDLIAGYPTNVPDEKIIIGGGFTQFNGGTNDYLARIYGGSISGSGAFQFPQAFYSVHESATNIVLQVLRTGGTSGTNTDGSGIVSVPFASSNLTAIAGVNYQTVVTNLNFPPGEVEEAVTIPVIDDKVVTNDLVCTLNLGDPAADPNPPYMVGLQPTAWLTIINDDQSIAFSSPTYSVAKNAVNSAAEISLFRVGGTNSTATVSFFTTTNGTAVTNLDYSPVSQLVTFLPGVTNVLVPVAITNNNIQEGNRTVYLSLTNVVGSNTVANSYLANPSNAVLTIIDTVNQPGQLSLSASNYTVTSGGSGLYTSATFNVIRSYGTFGTVSAFFSTASGTAVSGVNFVGTNGAISMVDGQTNQTFQVQLINSAIATAPLNFSLALTTPGGGATLVTPTNALVTMVNTNVGIGFVNATNVTIDTAGVVLVPVERVGDTNTTVSVTYATTNGTAVAGSNYLPATGTLSFSPGETQNYIAVNLLNNTNQTVPVYFTVGIGGPSAGVQLLSLTNSTVVMNAANCGLSFTNSAVSVLKTAGSAVITVVCSNTNAEPAGTNAIPLQVNYATADGTALSGQDYTATSGTLVFTNGQATNTFTVPILYNGLVGPDKAFTVSLSNPTAPGVLSNPSVQTVTIVNTVAGLSFSSSGYTVQKTGLAATITVNRSYYTNSTVSVNFTATNGTATAGVNFVATNGVLVFSNGVTSLPFTVPVIDTTTIQPDLTVALQLSNPSGGSALAAPSASTLTIHDNTGSFVVPVSTWLAASTGPDFGAGIIDPNTTNTVWFGFRDGGGTNVNNLMAVLLTTNGITPLAPNGSTVLAAETNTYGPLVYNGHSVSRPYQFSVRGTNGTVVTPTFRLLDATSTTTNIIGTNIFSFVLGTVSTTVANTNAIIINDNTNASPYPSFINVSGAGTTLVRSSLTLSNLWHSNPRDLDVLLVAPSGTNTLVMAHAGSSYAVTNLTVTFQDSASNSLPYSTRITAGTNKPTQFYPVPNFP